MSTRAMVFIDGTWLAVTSNRLADQLGVSGRTGGPLDFGALPRVCAQEIASQMALSAGIDVVRTHYFGSIAVNFDAQDTDAVQRRSEFFDSLRRHHRYEVYRFETDYRGHRVRRTPGDDGFTPPEKAVDVGLATSLLEMAAVSAYDIAIVVCGDRDFVPALQAVRRLGKRVALVSARGSCARELSDPNDPVRVRDFDVLWLDQLWAQVVSPAARPALRVVADQADAPAPLAAASSSPSDASPYADDDGAYGDASALDSAAIVADLPRTEPAAPYVEGVVTKTHVHGYGFVRADDGSDYYFRRSDFVNGSDFARLERFRSRLAFRVLEPARQGQAGRAVSLSLVGITDTPIVMTRAFAPREHTVREQTGRDASVYDTPRRESWTPVSVPALAPLADSVQDLWSDDPFAAPRRRVDEVTAVAAPHVDAPTEAAAVPPGDAPHSIVQTTAAVATPVDVPVNASVEPHDDIAPEVDAPRAKRAAKSPTKTAAKRARAPRKSAEA